MSDPEISVATAWAPLLDPSPPTCAQCPVPERYQHDEERLMLLTNLFTAAECERLIAASESYGFGRTAYPKQYRGNTRLITVDQSLTDAIWQRLKPLMPAELEVRQRHMDDYSDDDQAPTRWNAVGLNECWRLAKYVPGDRFGKHMDQSFVRDPDEVSMFTVNVYMNGGFEGGATRFYCREENDRPRLGRDADPDLVVRPEAGLAAIFRQPPGAALLHDGEALGSGVKYLFRTDVMYKRC